MADVTREAREAFEAFRASIPTMRNEPYLRVSLVQRDRICTYAESLVAALEAAEQRERDLRDAWRANVDELARQYGDVVRAAEGRARTAEEALVEARDIIRDALDYVPDGIQRRRLVKRVLAAAPTDTTTQTVDDVRKRLGAALAALDAGRVAEEGEA